MDRITTQVLFRRGIFTCPSCGTVDIVDWSMTGGNTYENNCSQCDKWNNSFTNYTGNISYTPEEYEALREGDLSKKKDELVDKFIYDRDNPPPYVEPSVEDLEREKSDLEERIAEIQSRIEGRRG